MDKYVQNLIDAFTCKIYRCVCVQVVGEGAFARVWMSYHRLTRCQVTQVKGGGRVGSLADIASDDCAVIQT